MDIFKYINSKDIADYLRKIKYSFTPAELAYLIWQSKNVTFEEKLCAWQEIIDTMPDIEIEECGSIKRQSLRSFLQKVLESRNDTYADYVFEQTWFYFPVPFKKGDIVCISQGKYKTKYSSDSLPFVLTGVCNWGF